MALTKFNSEAGFSVGVYPTIEVIDRNGNVIANSLQVTNLVDLGQVGNITITGGTSGQVLTTDGAGTLTFTTVAVDPVNPGGIDTSIQYNSLGEFAGDEFFTYNSSNGAVIANRFIGNGRQLSNIAGPNVVGIVPNANYAAFANVALNASDSQFVIGNYQPNITQLGNLEQANVTGAVIAETITANSALVVGGDATIVGNLLVQGTAFYANVTTVSILDPIIEQGGDPFGEPLTINDQINRGQLLHYYTTLPVDAFMGWDSNNSQFAFASNVSLVSNEVIIHSYGNVRAENFIGNGVGLTHIVGANVDGVVANANFASYANYATFAGTVIDPVQSNITTIGTLSNLSVTGAGTSTLGDTATANYFIGDGSNLSAIVGANVTGTVANANYATYSGSADQAGTVVNQSQPNITSTGTLINLSVTGEIISDTSAILGNSVTSNYFIGSGNNLSNIQSSNITGVVANANYAAYAGQVVDATQSNITAVGTLATLSVTGNVKSGIAVANFFFGDGRFLSNLNVGEIGTVDNAAFAENANVANYANYAGNVVNAEQGNITLVGSLVRLSVVGNIDAGNATLGNLVIANYFQGNAYRLSDVNGSNVSGVVANANFSAWTANANFSNTALLSNRVIESSQPNITSLGTLISLSVTSNITAGNATLGNLVTANFISTDGLYISNIQGSSIVGDAPFANYATYSGSATSAENSTLAGQVTNSEQPNIEVVGTLNYLDVSGNATADHFIGQGDLLTNISGPNVVGDVPTANYATFANNAYYSDLAINANTVTDAAQPNITSLGTLSELSVIGNVTAGNVVSDVYGNIFGNIESPGANTQVIYNNDGILGASTGFTYNDGTNTLSITGNISVGNVLTRNGRSVPTFVTQATAPTDPKLGDQWYDTDNDTIYQYIYDGVTFAWVDQSSGFTNSNVDAYGNSLVLRDFNGNVRANAFTGNVLSLSGNVTADHFKSVGNIHLVPGAGGIVDVNNVRIINVSTPSAASDAATRGYVDSVASGLDIKQSVHVATTTVLPDYTYAPGTAGVGATITAVGDGVLTIDGHAVEYNNRVLIKNETGLNKPYNGIYICTVEGDATTQFELTRTTDFDEFSEIPGAFMFVEIGYSLHDTGWVCTNDKNTTIVIGVGDINFTQFTATGATTVSDLTVTGKSDLNDVANVKILGGNVNYVMITDGTGNLSWAQTVELANYASYVGQVVDATQSNITSVGSLSSLSVVGNIVAGNANILGNLVLPGNVDFYGSNLSLGNVSNIRIPGGSANYVLATDGSSNLFWRQAGTGNANTAGSNTQIQYKYGDNLGANANLTFNVDTLTLATDTIHAISVSASGNVTGGNLKTTGNVFGANASITGNIDAGNLSLSGRVTANSALISILGQGSNRLPVYAAPSGILETSESFQFIPSVGDLSVTGNVTAGNGFRTGNIVSATGNITGGNLRTVGLISATGNVTGGNILTAGLISSTGNISGGNILTVGLISATGNVTANYYIGNGALLTDITGASVTGQVANALLAGTVYTNAQPNITSVGTLSSLSVAGSANVGNLYTDGLVSATGNITGNNANFAGGSLLLSAGTIAVSGANAGIFNLGISNISLGLAASNITMGSTGGTITARGNLVANNIVGRNFVGNGSNISVTTDTVIDSFSPADFRTAKYLVKAGSDTGFQSIEVLLVHNNSDSFITIYGEVSSTDSDIVTLSSNIATGNVKLYATAIGANTTVNLLPTYVRD